jgi:hypothetical protein
VGGREFMACPPPVSLYFGLVGPTGSGEAAHLPIALALCVCVQIPHFPGIIRQKSFSLLNN